MHFYTKNGVFPSRFDYFVTTNKEVKKGIYTISDRSYVSNAGMFLQHCRL